MTEHHIEVKRTARYVTLGELNENTKNIWFLLHGYGQLVEYFIKKFEVLDDGQSYIVAPEALSKFYLKGVGGRVGASWMTRDDRDAEIGDYICYLNELYDSVLKNHDTKNLKINLLAFSQGNATVTRWLNNGHITCNRLVLWAAYFGKGINDVIDPKKLENIEIDFVYGSRDEYLTQIELPKYVTEIKTALPHARVLEFEGNHTIDVPTLRLITNNR
jgi:predicted esterase